nr:hypothetical protein [Shuttle vector pI3]
MQYARDMPKLPPEVAAEDVLTVEKLVWLYIWANPGEHSDRSLWAELGVRPQGAIKRLLERGVLVQEEAPRGPKPGKYRAQTKAKKPAQEEPNP